MALPALVLVHGAGSPPILGNLRSTKSIGWNQISTYSPSTCSGVEVSPVIWARLPSPTGWIGGPCHRRRRAGQSCDRRSFDGGTHGAWRGYGSTRIPSADADWRNSGMVSSAKS